MNTNAVDAMKDIIKNVTNVKEFPFIGSSSVTTYDNEVNAAIFNIIKIG